jgi:hypothetical protein
LGVTEKGLDASTTVATTHTWDLGKATTRGRGREARLLRWALSRDGQSQQRNRLPPKPEEVFGLSLLRDIRQDRRSPPKADEVLTKGAKKMMVLLVAMAVLVVSGVVYAANSHPAPPESAASDGRDHQGIDDMPVVDGLDGLLGNAEDPEEQD